MSQEIYHNWALMVRYHQLQHSKLSRRKKQLIAKFNQIIPNHTIRLPNLYLPLINSIINQLARDNFIIKTNNQSIKTIQNLVINELINLGHLLDHFHCGQYHYLHTDIELNTAYFRIYTLLFHSFTDEEKVSMLNQRDQLSQVTQLALKKQTSKFANIFQLNTATDLLLMQQIYREDLSKYNDQEIESLANKYIGSALIILSKCVTFPINLESLGVFAKGGRL